MRIVELTEETREEYTGESAEAQPEPVWKLMRRLSRKL